jgi:hypothetical protein
LGDESGQDRDVIMSDTTQALRFRYSYEEFADHIKAMRTVRQWEYTSRFGHLGEAQTSQANSARVVEYFSDTYADQREALHKAELFLLISDYLARHTDIFSRKGLMEAEDDGRLSVEPALLRAVHYLFTAGPQPAGSDSKKVLALARAMRDIER